MGGGHGGGGLSASLSCLSPVSVLHWRFLSVPPQLPRLGRKPCRQVAYGSLFSPWALFLPEYKSWGMEEWESPRAQRRGNMAPHCP